MPLLTELNQNQRPNTTKMPPLTGLRFPKTPSRLRMTAFAGRSRRDF
jgi:hypothetical protein